jgi:hypothetical protein
MFAPSVYVEAGAEADIRTLVISDNGVGEIPIKFCSGKGSLLRKIVRVRFQIKGSETIGRIDGSAPAMNGLMAHIINMYNEVHPVKNDGKTARQRTLVRIA